MEKGIGAGNTCVGYQKNYEWLIEYNSDLVDLFDSTVWSFDDLIDQLILKPMHMTRNSSVQASCPTCNDSK